MSFANNPSLEADSSLEPTDESPADQHLDFSQENEQGTQPHRPRLLTYRISTGTLKPPMCGKLLHSNSKLI